MTSKTNMVREIGILKRQLQEYKKIANDNAKTCAKLSDDLINCRKNLIKEFEKIIKSIDTQYPDDDGEPFEVLACNYVKELKSKLKDLEKK